MCQWLRVVENILRVGRKCSGGMEEEDTFVCKNTIKLTHIGVIARTKSRCQEL